MRLSNAGAGSWSLVELFSISAVVLVLLRMTALPGVQAGELYAVLAYVWRVLECLDQFPAVVQRVTVIAAAKRSSCSDPSRLGPI